MQEKTEMLVTLERVVVLLQHECDQDNQWNQDQQALQGPCKDQERPVKPFCPDSGPSAAGTANIHVRRLIL